MPGDEACRAGAASAAVDEGAAGSLLLGELRRRRCRRLIGYLPVHPRVRMIRLASPGSKYARARRRSSTIIRAMRLFRKGRPVIGMVHLLPLPGSPRARALGDVRAAALADARTLARGGVDAVLVENYGDVPFTGAAVEPQVVAVMSVIAAEVRAATGLPVGINVLRNDAHSAVAVALASGASFIRVNVHVGSAETDQGHIDGKAHDTLRFRKAVGAEVAIFADVFVKHARACRAPAARPLRRAAPCCS